MKRGSGNKSIIEQLNPTNIIELQKFTKHWIKKLDTKNFV